MFCARGTARAPEGAFVRRSWESKCGQLIDAVFTRDGHHFRQPLYHMPTLSDAMSRKLVDVQLLINSLHRKYKIQFSKYFLLKCIAL